MLVLQFYLGDVMYVIKCQHVKEVAPLTALKKLPHSPACVAGLFNYRGAIVPVIDLRQFLHDTPCQLRLSTRIILVEYAGPNRAAAVFGMMAERITEAINRPDSDLLAPGLSMPDAPYLNGIMMENQDMIQLIDLDILAKSLTFLPMLENPDSYETTAVN